MLRAYQRYAEFTGRSTRTEYWLFVLTYSIGILAAMLLGGLFGVGDLFFYLVVLGSMVPSIAVTIRRLHDIDKSGWFMLLGLVPIVGGIILIVFALMPSTQGSNQYGPAETQDSARPLPL